MKIPRSFKLANSLLKYTTSNSILEKTKPFDVLIIMKIDLPQSFEL